MLSKRIIFVLLLLVSLTVAADSPVRRQGCRHVSLNPRPMTRGAKANSRKYLGEYRQLVILASFSDLKFKDEEPLSLWKRIFNEEHFNEEPFYGSVHDYFNDQSFGKFNLQFDLYHVPLGQSSSLYRSKYLTYEGKTYADDSGAGLMFTHLLDAMKEQVEDWSVYDWDDDGKVDQVIILFAGKGQNDGGGTNTIWPNQWSLSEQGEAPFLCEWGHPYDLSDIGWNLIVDNYACFAELTKQATYGSFGTLCHEFGHCLGLPDFYYGAASQVVGSWDIMDYGNNNLGGYCPPGYSAHERMLLGWLDVTELTDPTSISDMKALSEGGEAYLIRNDGFENEYYIVENRQQTGWDKALPSSGVVVFHIDYDEEVWLTGIPNSTEQKRYTIIPANNKTSISSSAYWPYPFSVNNMLTNTSAPKATLFHPNTDGTKLMSKPLTDIKVTDSVASFQFMGGATGIIESLAPGAGPYKVFTLSGCPAGSSLHALPAGVYVVRDSSGQTRKIIKKDND